MIPTSHSRSQSLTAVQGANVARLPERRRGSSPATGVRGQPVGPIPRHLSRAHSLPNLHSLAGLPIAPLFQREISTRVVNIQQAPSKPKAVEYQPIYKANVSLEKKLDRQIRNLVERRPDTRLQDTTQDDNSDSPQVTPGQRTPQEPVAVEDKIIDRVPNEEALKKIFAHDGDSIEANLCRKLCSLVAAWHVGRACYITYRNRILSEYQPNRVNEALHALEWCRVLDAYPDQLPQGFEDLQQALELAEQQLFSPLIWRLCGRILQRGQWTLSPTSLIPLLSALYRQRDHNRYMLAWTLTSESEILYMTGEYRPEDCLALTPTQQALLSLAYGPVWHNTKPVPEPFRLLKEKEQRYLTAIIVYICVNAIDTNLPRQAFRRSAAKYRRKAEQSYQQELDWQMSIHTQDLNMREKGRLQRELKRSLQREKSLYATKVSHAIGEKSSINGRLDDLNK